jgi:hypothetical protein
MKRRFEPSMKAFQLLSSRFSSIGVRGDYSEPQELNGPPVVVRRIHTACVGNTS